MSEARLEIEQRERQTLAPYAVFSGASAGRRCPEPPHPRRTCFQRDRGRVVHCTAFRRTQYKTQVFVNDEGDHFRTRLTHTLEVTGLARNLARCLRVNEDLTEVVALAHDLGHTPFGHAGESALNDLMADHGGFEHNAQSLRVVDVLESPYPHVAGLNLSAEVRECIARHATVHDQPTPSPEFPPHQGPPLEGQLVEVADAIAYDSHDVEDALRAGLIAPQDPAELAIWAEAAARVDAQFPGAEPALRARRVAKKLIELMMTDALAVAEANLEQLAPASAADVRAAGRRLVGFSPAMRQKLDALEAFLMQRVYRHHRVSRMMTKASRFIRELFAAYCGNPAQLPPEHQDRIETVGLHRTICDYVAGMTDRYCQDEYLRLFMPFERV